MNVLADEILNIQRQHTCRRLNQYKVSWLFWKIEKKEIKHRITKNKLGF